MYPILILGVGVKKYTFSETHEPNYIIDAMYFLGPDFEFAVVVFVQPPLERKFRHVIVNSPLLVGFLPVCTAGSKCAASAGGVGWLSEQFGSPSRPDGHTFSVCVLLAGNVFYWFGLPYFLIVICIIAFASLSYYCFCWSYCLIVVCIVVFVSLPYYCFLFALFLFVVICILAFVCCELGALCTIIQATVWDQNLKS